jgi:STE24 endopeptidase
VASFDPAAATAAYMATLSPAEHAKATAYTHGAEWLLLWSWLVAVIVAVVIVRSGVLRQLRDRIERGRPHPNLAVLGCSVVFVLASWLLTLPWSAYSSWWRERSYGLSSQAFTGWLRDGLIQHGLLAMVSSLFYLVLFALMRRAPRTWWAWAGGVTAIFAVIFVVIAPVLIEPLFNHYTPAPPGPVRDAVVKLAHQVGVPSDKIEVYNGSWQSNRYTANVSGLFGSARIAMSDTMFAQGADISEVRGVVGHEMGHYVLKHVLWYSRFLAVMALAGFFLVDRLFAAAARLLRADGVRGVSDPAGLPVLGAVLATLALLATPVFNTATRIEESQADHFSLVHAHEPDGLSKALVKTIAYRASSPAALEEFVFYDHPSVMRRVRRAMDWKAANPDLVGR